MRIIGGRFKGRRFNPPANNWPTRPTTDFAKEGLFNILNNHLEFDTLKVLDLFCCTGSHTYEFVSRGCTDVTCVDKFGGCIRFVNKMVDNLGIREQVKVTRMDVFKFITRTKEQYDYIFAGPPYALSNIDDIPDLVFQHKLLRPEGWLVLEHQPKQNYERHPHFQFVRNYGKTTFSFFGS